MNLGILSKVGGPAFQKLLFKASKHAPEILTGVGITAVVAGTIVTGHAAATKHSKLVAGARERVDAVKTKKLAIEGGNFVEDEVTQNYGREMTLAYARTSVDVVKVYGPGVSLTAAGIVSILAAHGIMHRRAVVLAGALKALESGFQAYREKVVEKYGEEVDRDFNLGIRTEKVKDEETGKTKSLRSFDSTRGSIYAKFFDEYSEYWHKDPDYNLAFLKAQQNWANDRLQIQGYLFLCDVYDALGIPRTPQSMLVGWTVGLEDSGDGKVDFDIYNADNTRFVNGLERSVLLDFNVEGYIVDKI